MMQKHLMKKILLCCLIIFASLNPAWAGNQKIVITCTEWEPYTSEKLLNGGFLIELTVESLKRVGYDVEVKYLPWARALDEVKNGRYQALVGASFTEERTQFLAYPTNGWENKVVFFTKKKGNITYKKVEDLCPAKVGLLNGSFLIEKLASVPCLKQELAPDVISNLGMLFAGRFDYLLESKDAINYLIRKEFPEKVGTIKAIAPPFYIDKVYTAFSKNVPGYEKIVKDYDKGMNSLKKDGTYKSILKKHNMQ